MQISIRQNGRDTKVVLNLEDHDPRYLVVERNGNLEMEVVLGDVSTAETLHSEVENARCLKSIPVLIRAIVKDLSRNLSWEDHANPTLAKKKNAFARGVVDGVQKLTAPHPYPGVPPILLESSKSYTAGYEWGESLVNLVERTA